MAFIRTSKTRSKIQRELSSSSAGRRTLMSESAYRRAGREQTSIFNTPTAAHDADLQSWKALPESERTRICMDDMAKAIKADSDKTGKQLSSRQIESDVTKIAETRDKKLKK